MLQIMHHLNIRNDGGVDKRSRVYTGVRMKIDKTTQTTNQSGIKRQYTTLPQRLNEHQGTVTEYFSMNKESWEAAKQIKEYLYIDHVHSRKSQTGGVITCMSMTELCK